MTFVGFFDMFFIVQYKWKHLFLKVKVEIGFCLDKHSAQENL